MPDKSTIEAADRWSRRRALGFVVATVAFLGVQLITRPVFLNGNETAGNGHAVIWTWALNAVGLMLCLYTGGGLALKTKVRALMNDEVSRANYRAGTLAGYWVSMIAGMVLYVVAGYKTFTGREAAYIIVTSGVSVALLVFSYLEYRAHAD